MLKGEALTWEQVQQFGLQGVLQAHEFIMVTAEKLQAGVNSRIPALAKFFHDSMQEISDTGIASRVLQGRGLAGEAIETGGAHKRRDHLPAHNEEVVLD